MRACIWISFRVSFDGEIMEGGRGCTCFSMSLLGLPLDEGGGWAGGEDVCYWIFRGFFCGMEILEVVEVMHACLGFPDFYLCGEVEAGSRDVCLLDILGFFVGEGKGGEGDVYLRMGDPVPLFLHDLI